MKLDQWLRFTWDVTKLAGIEQVLPEHYEIARAAGDDEKELRRVISSAFTLDAAWNATINEIESTVNSWLDRAFANSDTMLLALRHGTRIIGAGAVSLNPENDVHLAPGPCVLAEYRNRGFGTHLLAHSLATLRDAGVRQGSALAMENSPAAKFLYAKFHGSAVPCDFTPLLAA